MDKTTILGLADKPGELETLYRGQPNQFRKAFPAALAERPDAILLQAWQERLFYSPGVSKAGDDRLIALVLAVVLSLIATAMIKAGGEIDLLPKDWFLPRFTAPIILTAIIIYYLNQYRPAKQALSVIAASLLVCYLYALLLPDQNQSDTSTLTFIYTPFILWSTVYLAYAGANWRSSELRMNFIRYTGELLVMSIIILLGGMVLTMMSFALFKLIDVNAEKIIIGYVVVWGLIATPIIATYVIDRVMENSYRLAAVLARVFAPIFLMLVVVYLIFMIIEKKSPWSDREFLLTFNILLLIVLAIAIYSISEFSKQGASKLLNAVNVALIGATLIINFIALSAIIYRVSSFGITPNRVAVLGTNLVIFINLIGILKQYLPVLKGSADYSSIEQWCARYLPVYTGWSIFVALLMPLLFWFK